MKVKLSLAAIVVVGFIVLGACNTTSSVGSTSSPAYNSGQLFGSSLLSLYSDYKQAGKIDMSNTGTMLQVAQLATSIIVKTKSTGFQNQKYKKSTFYKKDSRLHLLPSFLYEFPALRDEVQ